MMPQMVLNSIRCFFLNRIHALINPEGYRHLRNPSFSRVWSITDYPSIITIFYRIGSIPSKK